MDDSDKDGHKRVIKYTPKAQEESLNRLVNLRKSKMAQITIQMKEIDKLKENYANVERIEQEVLTTLTKLYQEFIELNESVQELLLDDERKDDQHIWFEPKSSKIRDYVIATEQWIEHVKNENAAKNDDIEPGDSVSEVASAVRKKSRAGSSAGNSCATSSATSSSSNLRVKEEAEKAALLAKAAALKKKQALQVEEVNLKAKLEQLELRTAIAVSNAKLKVYDEHENSGESVQKYVQPEHALDERMSGLKKDSNGESSDVQAATRRKQKPVAEQTRLHNASQNCQKSESSEDNCNADRTKTTGSKTSRQGYYFEGDQKMPAPGTTWHPFIPPFGYIKCAVCTCKDSTGEVHCEKVTCPALTCSRPIRRNPSDCCKECPEEDTVPLDDDEMMQVDGTRHCKLGRNFQNSEHWHPSIPLVGEMKCITCWCDHGVTKCQ